MIKGSGFLKLLKQSCFILLISCFILLGNFSSSYEIGYRADENGKNYTVLDNGVFSSYSGSQEIKFLPSYTSNKLGFFWNDNKLYCYNAVGTNIILQGYIKKYGICNGYCGSPSNFNFDHNYDENVIGEFLHNIGSGDTRNEWQYMSNDPKSALYLTDTDTNISYMFQCLNDYIDIGNLIDVNSYQGYSSLNSNLFGNPPGYSSSDFPGGSLDGSFPGDFQNIYTGDYVYSTCTYGDIINYYESQGMSKYLCYGGIDNWNFYNPDTTYNPEPGTGLSIVSITSYSSNWSSPRDWFDYWNGLYVNTDASQTFVGRPAVYHTFLDLYYIYGGNSFDFDSVYKYCGLKVFNINTSTVYTGSMFNKECKNIQIQKRSSSSSGENVVGLNFGSGQKTYTDGTVFITDFFNLLKSNLVVGYGDSFGFLPSYIIIFLLVIILFRFISH